MVTPPAVTLKPLAEQLDTPDEGGSTITITPTRTVTTGARTRDPTGTARPVASGAVLVRGGGRCLGPLVARPLFGSRDGVSTVRNLLNVGIVTLKE